MSCVGLRGRESTVSCCLSAEVLPNISYWLSSLGSIVLGLYFGPVFCLRDLLLTQVQRWTKHRPWSSVPFAFHDFFLYIPSFPMQLSQLHSKNTPACKPTCMLGCEVGMHMVVSSKKNLSCVLLDSQNLSKSKLGRCIHILSTLTCLNIPLC